MTNTIVHPASNHEDVVITKLKCIAVVSVAAMMCITVLGVTGAVIAAATKK